MRRFLFIGALLTAFLFVGCNSDDSSGGSGVTDQDIPETVDVDQDEIPDEDVEEHSGTLPANRYVWKYIINTGQTKCYNNETEIECPKVGQLFFGQDGNYRVGVRSYDYSSGDGTVIDNATHLRWQRGFATDMTWYQAKTYCQELRVGDTRWRLPTAVELKTLVDYGRSSPAINTSAFPNTPNEWFWATEARNADNSSWMVYFLDGFVEYTAKTNKYAVRCVER